MKHSTPLPAALVLFCLTVASHCFAQTEQNGAAATPGDTAVTEAYLDRTAALMREVTRNLDRSAFDFDALLESLDYDAEEIVAYCKTSIAFEQYPGALRGPLGTLFSRAGNAIDQSLLLAKLLRDAGFEARIAQARLSEGQAARVLSAMKRPMAPETPFGDSDAILDALGKYGVLATPPTAEQRSDYAAFVAARPKITDYPSYTEVTATAEDLLEQLRNNGLSLDNAPDAGPLLQEALDYYWVQFKDGAADPWSDVHPVFADDAGFEALQPSAYIAGEVPEELLHKLRVQVFIERKKGASLEVIPVTDPWERPVANLVGVPLTFTNIADSMLGAGALSGGLDDLLANSSSFVPGFGSAMAPGAMFFDLSGNRIDPMAASDSAAGIFATLNQAFGGTIAKIGDESSVPTLTAQWVDLTLVAPGGEETRFRRTLFDRIGKAARDNRVPLPELERTTHEDARELLRRHTLMVDVGGVPRGYVIEAAYSHYLKARPAIEAVLDLNAKRTISAAAAAEVPAGWAGHLALFSRFDAIGTASPGNRNYRSGPAIVLHSEGLGDQTRWKETIDIISNPRRAVDISGASPVLAPAQAMVAGVWETRVEGSLLGGETVLNTFTVLGEASKDGIGISVLKPGQSSDALAQAPDVNAAIDADLQRGYAVVAPAAAPRSGHAGWWRIDPATGETLGQIGDGRGGELVETLVTGIVSLAAFTYGAVQCQGAGSSAAQACCHTANAGMALFTVGIGIGLEGAAGAIASITLDFNRSVLPTADVCDALFSYRQGFGNESLLAWRWPGDTLSIE